MSRRSRAHRSVASELATLALATFALGCRSPDALEHIEAAIAPSGELRMFARRMTGQDEGGDLSARSFHYAEQRDGSWRATVVPGGDGASRGFGSGETTYRLLRAPDGRMRVVANVRDGTRVLEETAAGAWEPVAIDPALPVEARAALDEPEALGNAWVGSDGELRVLLGEWLLETREGRLARALWTGESCIYGAGWFFGTDPPDAEGYSRWGCLFEPTGDRAGDAAVFETTTGTRERPMPLRRTRLRRLRCELDACVWENGPIDHGLGTTEPGDDQVFFHLADGTPILIEGPYTILAWGGGHVIAIGSDDVFRFGAAPRPSGGFVVVTSAYYTDALVLTVVSEAFEPRSFALPTIALAGTLRLTVVIAPASAGAAERAHLLLSTSASSIAHLDVDLETGAVSREDFGL